MVLLADEDEVEPALSGGGRILLTGTAIGAKIFAFFRAFFEAPGTPTPEHRHVHFVSCFLNVRESGELNYKQLTT